ncbi:MULTISPECIES: Uma2 family endonuclease [unclassified Roseofilum]|uniref:Uma2 family endonuclease n=1 Tax=unclassified Roseofilum TaxID=2620099 RepID=UPI001AFEA3E5|nr:MULTISPECIES: Uma2 family endonuclease [unclassified Roseofilum]MBP0008393.1 Uma2 family endonuclease [Roseofilum sp. Belize Diploria]MBP0015772.1 Uma2 family endonuclease [Roseofilum sp. SID3]MBP0025654.1 Uma2 family endonuclease [Roseofilum sp. SID2]MBP0033291.1 Uma2 family endonuclease [Roseofilum sp. Belize BBD 4]MBP0036565.1 Uma2 family endonuclease [Roseofilum sp. SID1]
MIFSTIITQNIEIPRLENGDRLSRAEFERRYNNMPELKKAELIEGIVYMASALRIKQHGKPHSHIMGWLFYYEAMTQGVESGDNCTVILDNKNEPQPDGLLRLQKEGLSRINDAGYVEGAPELVVEIAASTVSLDLHDKLQVYCRHQVQEYLVWRVQDNEIDWFRLRGSEYEKLEANEQGIIPSEVYPGLWLDVPALLRGDLAQVLQVLQAGIATEEHQDFVQFLSNL